MTNSPDFSFPMPSEHSETSPSVDPELTLATATPRHKAERLTENSLKILPLLKNPISLHKADHDPRAAALVALSRVLTEGVDSQAAVDDALRPATLVPTNKRLCTELVYGTLREFLRLVWFSQRFLRRPDKLPEEMRLVMVMALYEMIFLRIPPRASVGWAVSHIQNRFGQGLAKVTNGSLRAMQRSLTDFHKPDLYEAVESLEERLALRYAMPLWIVRLWLKSYGEKETQLLLRASLEAAPVGLRLNKAAKGWEAARQELLTPDPQAPRPNSKNGRDSETSDFPLVVGECCLAFHGSLPWQGRIMIKEGRATRQSAASFAVLDAFLPAFAKQPVWDCCSGRGGKTLALLEANISVALATDPSGARLAALPREYERLGLQSPACPEIWPLAASEAAKRLGKDSRSDTPDSEPPLLADSAKTTEQGTRPVAETPETFGTVLVDAPCSGLGTLSRHPEIRLRRTEADVERLSRTQKTLLDAAWSRLQPGGNLLYLTCTRSPAENEEQIASFVARTQGAHIVKEYQTPAESPLREFFYGAWVQKDVLAITPNHS